VARNTKAIGDLFAQREEKREELKKVRARRQHIADLPEPFDVVFARLESRIHAAREKFDGRLDNLHGLIESGLIRSEPLSAREISFTETVELLAWLQGDTIIERLRAEVHKRYPRETITATDREKKLRALDAQILDIERQEERLTEELEELGLTVDRRGDLDPRAFLSIE
jgi:hypothetical protein